MTHNVKPDDVAEAIKDTAERYIRPRFRALNPEDIRSKSHPNDLVTKADTEAEEALEIILPKILPGSLVLGEEGLSAGRYVMADKTGFDGHVWVIDPVDGTNNFASGSELFATMVSLTHKGQTIMSWIYDLMAGTMFQSIRGEGAYKNGERIHLKARQVETPLAYVHPHLNKRIQTQFPDSPHLKWQREALFATSHEYIRLLKGQGDIGLYRRMMPWDHVAGCLAMNEAGGIAQTWAGGEYGLRVMPWETGVIATSNPALLEQIKPMIRAYQGPQPKL